MKVTLLSPSMYIASPGIRMISACLKRAGHQTKIIFIKTKIGRQCDENTFNSVVKLSSGSDLIGISLTTNFFEISAQISKRIKKELKTHIVWGGVHPTARPDECLEYADIVCRGEGEGAMVELAEKIEKGMSYYNVKNLCFKNKKGDIIINSLRPIIQDLDSLPFLDYGPKDHYIIAEGNLYKMDNPYVIKLWDNYDYTGQLYTTLITRGCPFSCAYCCNNMFNKIYHGQKIFRVRSVDNVIEELKIIKKNLPFIKCIFFNDDYLLGLPLNYIKEFSEKYKKYINLSMIIVGVHPVAVNEKKLDYLVNAGNIKYLAMGIQTASERMKKLFKRDYSNSQIEKAAKIINKFKDKIERICFEVIVDIPWQTDKDLIDTLMFLSRLPVPYYMNVFSLIFYPGTELYDLARKDGYIKNEKKEIYQKNYLKFPAKTYLNKVFFLVQASGIKGRRIYPIVMFLLTNELCRKTYLSRILFSIMANHIRGGWKGVIVAGKRKIRNFNLIKKIICRKSQ